jgi:hypothetical protein
MPFSQNLFFPSRAAGVRPRLSQRQRLCESPDRKGLTGGMIADVLWVKADRLCELPGTALLPAGTAAQIPAHKSVKKIPWRGFF